MIDSFLSTRISIQALIEWFSVLEGSAFGGSIRGILENQEREYLQGNNHQYITIHTEQI